MKNGGPEHARDAAARAMEQRRGHTRNNADHATCRSIEENRGKKKRKL